MLAFIAKGLEYKSSEVLLQLYRVSVRPHLEYCVHFLVSLLKEGCGGIGGSSEEVHQIDSGDERADV